MEYNLKKPKHQNVWIHKKVYIDGGGVAKSYKIETLAPRWETLLDLFRSKYSHSPAISLSLAAIIFGVAS